MSIHQSRNRSGTRLRAMAGGLVLAWAACTPAQAQDAAHGKQLYNTAFGTQKQGCSTGACHGPQGNTLTSTNKLRNGVNNPARIQAAIDADTGKMGFLKPYLSSTDVADIAAYLGNPAVSATAPSATVSPTSLSFAATTLGASAAQQTVTLSNAGTAPLLLSAFSASSTVFPLGGGTCVAGGSVAAGGSCTVLVGFRPVVAGAASASLNFTHNASSGTSSVALSGTGVAATPAIVVSPAALSFTQMLGSTSASQTVSISNTGTGALLLSTLAITGAQAGEFSRAGTCAAGGSVAPGASCTVLVSFTPAAAGARSASLAIAHNATGGSSTVALSGTGTATAQAVMALNGNALNFSAQPLNSSSPAQAVTLSNAGQAALVLASVSVGGAQPGDYQVAGTCAAGLSIAPGAACTVQVVFAPLALGTRAAAITVASNALNGDAVIPLAGTAVAAAAPAVTLTPTAQDFGAITIGSTSVRTVSLSNTGTDVLALSGITVAGSGFTGSHTCGTSLAAGSSCVISLVFKPTGGGARSGSVSVASNAAGSPHGVALSGSGVSTPQGTVAWAAAAPLVFQDVQVGVRSAPQVLTLGNQGPNSVLLAGVSTQGTGAGDFVLGGDCTAGSTLAVGSTCTVTVVFGPAQVGTRTATLNVASNGANPGALSLSGRGVTVGQKQLGLSPASLDFPPQELGAPPATVPVTVSNTGTAPVMLSAVSVSSAAFSLGFDSAQACAPMPLALAPGQSCQVDVSLLTSQAGQMTGTLTVTSDARESAMAVHARVDAVPMSNVGAGGCSLAPPGSGFDPLLLVLCALAGVVLWRGRQPALVEVGKEKSHD